MFPFIVADIGGTNARFALATGKQGDQFEIEHICKLKGKDFDSFEHAMAAYIDKLGGIKVQAASVAIAAPIDGDQVSMTNLSWSFSQAEVQKKFGFKCFAAINDYTAVAVATSRLGQDDVTSVVAGTRKPQSNKAVLGPGSGLGAGGLAYVDDKHWQEIPSEGGHATIGPANKFEAQVIGALYDKYDYVSAETCLSGPGLVNLYHAVSAVNGVKSTSLEAHQVTEAALDGSDEQCKQALLQFCAFLGTMSSNLALTYGAKGGVYITGGIVPRFVDFIKASEFEARFRNKGVMSRYVADIPVDLVTFDETAYLGAAAWLEQRLLEAS